MRWRPIPTKDPTEISGPMKRIVPKGLLLAHAGKQTATSSNDIECGQCHAVIYRPEKKFDETAFQAAMKAHYSISPKCADE